MNVSVGLTERQSAVDVELTGRFTDTFENVNSNDAHAVAIQSDGKIVIAGTAYNNFRSFTEAPVQDSALARYNIDGTLDSSFGKLITGGNPNSGFTAIALDSSGDIFAR